jgi:hypothetical protein
MLISSNMDAKLSFFVLYPKFQTPLPLLPPKRDSCPETRRISQTPGAIHLNTPHSPPTPTLPPMDPRDEALQYCFLTTLFSLFVSSTPKFARFPMGFLPHCSLSSLGRDDP